MATEAFLVVPPTLIRLLRSWPGNRGSERAVFHNFWTFFSFKILIFHRFCRNFRSKTRATDREDERGQKGEELIYCVGGIFREI